MRTWLDTVGRCTVVALSLLPLTSCDKAKELYDKHMTVFAIEPKAYELDVGAATIGTVPAPPSVRTGGDVAVSGGKVYIFGGQDEQGYPSDAVDVYDPATQGWTAGAPWSNPRLLVDYDTIGNQIYFSPGAKNFNDKDMISVFDRFDPATNTWTELTPISGNFATTELSVHNANLLVLGGRDEAASADVSTAYLYNDTGGTWDKLANLPGPCNPYQSATMGDTIYILGCKNSDASNQGFFAYNVPSNAWEQPPAPPVRLPELSENRVFVHGTQLVFYDQEARLLRTYDASAKQWFASVETPGVSKPTKIASVLVNDAFFVAVTADSVNGQDAPMFKVYRYDLTAATWSLFAEGASEPGLILRPAVVGSRLFFFGATCVDNVTIS